MMNDWSTLVVIKRDRRFEPFVPRKILNRLEKLCSWPYKIDVALKPLVNGIIKMLFDELPDRTIEYSAMDFMILKVALRMLLDYPQYYILISRFTIFQLHEKTIESFSAVVTNLYRKRLKEEKEFEISKSFYETVVNNADRLEEAIDFERDYLFDYIGIEILKQSYLFKINGVLMERPQHLLMRVSLAVHGNDIDAALETYDYMSKGYFLHSCQTLLSAGTVRPQCCLSTALTLEDSKDGVFKCLTQTCQIVKGSVDVGISVHSVPAKGSHVAGTTTKSMGLGPLHLVFNDSLNSVVEGGDLTFYLEPWHADIFNFLDLKLSWQDDGAPDLHYAVWIPDLFMERVINKRFWSLMCPSTCPGLSEVWGDDFKKLYEQYERSGKGVIQVEATVIWNAILKSQIRINSPLILFKDHCNRKSNHQHLGTIKGSTLGTETLQFFSNNEFAVTNTASIAINKFLNEEGNAIDIEKLKLVAGIVTKNLNKLIDINSNLASGMKMGQLRHRPLAIGVEGLAEILIKLRLPYGSREAMRLNKIIFETIYFGAMKASNDLAQQDGHYVSYRGSPLSKGLCQFDFWKKNTETVHDWTSLKKKIAKSGTRNSLLVAIKRPDHISYILGTSDTVEPLVSYIYNVVLFNEEFFMINTQLVNVLLEENLWDKSILLELLRSKGSIEGCDNIPLKLKAVFKTAYDIDWRDILEAVEQRGPFIDQNQAVNLYLKDNSLETLSCIYCECWLRELKSCPYSTEPKLDYLLNKLIINKNDEVRENFSLLRNQNLSNLVSSNDESNKMYIC